MSGDEYDRRENVWGQVTFILKSCVQVLGQFEAVAGEFGRLGMILRHLPLIVTIVAS